MATYTAPWTLTDIAGMNDCDKVTGLIDEASKVHPEIALFPARTIKGVQYKTLVRTANPTVAFRAANTGTAAVNGSYEDRTVSTYLMNPIWQGDKAVIDAYEDGPEAWLAMEASAIVNAAFTTVFKQAYYGTTDGDANGFPGLNASVAAGRVIDATGTAVGAGSSVWGVKFGPQGVQLVVGQNGSMAVSDPRIETLYDGSDNPYTGYVQELVTRVGLQVGNVNGLCMIKNLTEDSGKGLTDSLLARMVATCPVGYRPDVILMSRRSRRQLQQSRTATNATGAPAPTPIDFDGIPLVATDSILDSEAIA